MATGRTHPRWMRFYADGYDLSGFARQISELKQEFGSTPDAALTDAVKNVLVGQASLGVGALNAFFDNTATVGLQAALGSAGASRTVMVLIGMRGNPAQGDPVYAAMLEQLEFRIKQENGYVVANVPFGDADAVAPNLAYTQPWGVLLHAKAAETAVNTATGVDDFGAATTVGGYLCYEIFSSNGTVTVKIQDAETNSNGSFADLSGATSGSQDASSTPKAGIVALARNATVRRYLRWQIVLGTATTVTFALSFHRATY